MTHRGFLRCALIALFPLSPLTAQEIRTYIDTDAKASTGCSVATPGGTFGGFDEVIVTTVDRSAKPARITGVMRAKCSGETFGAPKVVNGTGWPLGVGNGTDGSDAVEYQIDYDGMSDFPIYPFPILVTAGNPGGPAVDAFSAPVLISRKHRSGRSANRPDWTKVSPLATDPAGDSTGTVDLRSVFAQSDDKQLFLRVDAAFQAAPGVP